MQTIEDYDIPEEIEFNAPLKKHDPIMPIDNNISENSPVTESYDFKRKRKGHSPEMSKVVDETEKAEDSIANIPDSEEFSNLNKLLRGK